MKIRLASTPALALGFILGFALAGPAPAQAPASGESLAELDALVERIQVKIREGRTTAADFAAETADFARLRVKAAELPSGQAARVFYLNYTFRLEVLKDRAGAQELRRELEAKYRPHLAGTSLGREFELQERAARARQAQAELVGKPAPELNFIWSSQDGLTRLSALRGKVVVLDFWATWCGPCVATFPQLRELVAHYRGADVIVLGVTSLQGYVAGLTPARIDTKDDPRKEFAATAEFITAKEMTWPVVFTEERVFNPHYGVTGIPHLTIIAPDGTVRHNGLHPGLPHADKVRRIDQILAEFASPTGGAPRGKPLP